MASRTVGSRTWKRGSNEPTPIRSSSAAGKLQPYSGRHVRAVDPDLHVVARAVRVDLEPAARSASGGWIVLPGAEHPPPPERVDDVAGAECHPGPSATVWTAASPSSPPGRIRASGPLRRQPNSPGNPRRRIPFDLRGLERERSLFGQQPRTASGSRTSRTSMEAGTGHSRTGCGSRVRRRSAGTHRSGPSPRATRSASRTPRSAARRSRSGRSASPTPLPASSRATARPAKLAPQISTSHSRSSRVRATPRLVALRGTASG